MVGNLLIGGFLAFFITFYAVPKVLKVAIFRKLYDIPNDRKVHTTPIPSLGGVAIFAGFITSLLICSIIEPSNSLQFFILSFFVVFFFGIKDDIVGLSPTKKMIGQILAGIILTFKTNLLITNLHGFLGIYAINGSISYVLTMFTIIVVMNAYNLIDGIDGLAASISVITAGVFSWFFLINNDIAYAMIGITFSCSLLAFLIFNFPPAKIFMGDTGSMMCGIVNSILVIHFIETSYNNNFIKISSSTALGFGILIMPLLDTLRVFSVRILNGKSPFFPDRNHLHHLLLDRGLSHKVITLIMSGAALGFMVLTYIALPLGTTPVIILQISLFFVAVFFLQITAKKNKAKLKAINKEDITFAKKIRHVVTLIVAKEPEERLQRK